MMTTPRLGSNGHIDFRRIANARHLRCRLALGCGGRGGRSAAAASGTAECLVGKEGVQDSKGSENGWDGHDEDFIEELLCNLT